MRRILVALLSVVLTFGVLTTGALAGRCSDDGCSGARLGGSGGDGYVQRDSGLWVPNRDGYIQQRTPIDPAVKDFGQAVAKDMAKDYVKGALKAAGGALAAGVVGAVESAFEGMTRETLDWFNEAFAGPIL